MKKQFAKLSKAEQDEIEAAYHNMNPQEFDDLMSHAKLHHPGVKSRPKFSKTVRRKPETATKPHASK